MTHETENLPPEQNQPTLDWVLFCTDTSIAAGQKSVLAVFEVFAAVGLYWWLASLFEWHWMAFLSMVAAPILLLRSNESITLGIKLLRSYWVPGYEKKLSFREKLFLFLTIATITIPTSYWFLAYGLINNIGWSFFWCVITLVICVLAIAFVITIATVGPGAIMGTKIVNSVVYRALANTLLVPFVALGLVIRGLCIRLYATLRHPHNGLAQLPQNWRETMLVIDFLHLPELLPQASTVNPGFGVKGAWVMQQKFNRLHRITGSLHILTLYIPALIYRFSLKASAWLWFPLALALKPPLHQKKAQDSRRLIASLHTWNWLYFGIGTVIMLWLFSSSPLLVKLLPVFPPEYTTVHNILATLPTPPVFGLLYIQILACFACLLATSMIIRSTNLKASHGKLFDSPNEFTKLSETDQSDFLSIAKSIDRIRLSLIAVLFLWGEMMALGFFHAHHPHTVEQFISPALLSYL